MAKGYWEDIQNQRDFMNRLGLDLNIKEMNDWYDVTVVDVIDRGGSGILNKHGNSLISILIAVYPEHSWQYKPIQIPEGYWNDLKTQRKYFDRLGRQLGIQSMDDWYKISSIEVKNKGGSKFLKQYYGDSLSKALGTVYSEHNWQE
jgi:hypothetical protein